MPQMWIETLRRGAPSWQREQTPVTDDRDALVRAVAAWRDPDVTIVCLVDDDRGLCRCSRLFAFRGYLAFHNARIDK